MAVKKKSKKLTNREKQLRKEVRSQLREDGILPPVKPRLNRSRFSKEVQAEFETMISSYGDFAYLMRGLACMLPADGARVVSSEQVGVLKVLKLATEFKKFYEQKASQGESSATIGEIYEQVIKPIVDL